MAHRRRPDIATNALSKLVNDPRAGIYIALRLFDFEEKLKAERLAEAVEAGVAQALQSGGSDALGRKVTFVPFRDSDQNGTATYLDTQAIYAADLERLKHTALLAAYYDGVAKDEGVGFELGYCYAKGVPFLLVSTDFISWEFPGGQVYPFDPLPYVAASGVVRETRIPEGQDFRARLIRARGAVLESVAVMVAEILRAPLPQERSPEPGPGLTLLEFGGGVYEWQRQAIARLGRLGSSVHGSRRCSAGPQSDPAELARLDLRSLRSARRLVVGVDSDEAPPGTAFLQGMACALGVEVWMYSSRSLNIVGPLGYRMSRNLMLDYSSTRTFLALDDLEAALRAALAEEQND